MDIRFIDFDKDTVSAEDAFWYRVVWVLGEVQEIILRQCIGQPVWRSFDGRVNTPGSMSDTHLTNTILFCERNGETEATYEAMVKEAKRRNLRIDRRRNFRS